jgi:hypothetical protein
MAGADLDDTHENGKFGVPIAVYLASILLEPLVTGIANLKMIQCPE